MTDIDFVALPSSLSYSEVLDIQTQEFNRKVELRRKGLSPGGDKIFLVEHQPVLTLGLHGDLRHLVVPSDYLKAKGVDFVKINRGGDITYHGPGQLTVYPVIDLLRYRLGVKDYVSLLEQAVIDTLSCFQIKGERIEGKTGVWIGKGSSNERKISAIGIKCSRFITMHGIALNVGPNLEGFNYIVPCGLPQGITSISRELGREVTVEEVKPLFRSKLISLLLPRIPAREIS